MLGLAIRASGVVMLTCTLPVIRSHLAHPWWSALLAGGLAAENAAVALWWLARRRPDPRVLWLDLPVGTAAIVLNSWLTPRHGAAGWALFVYPNTVLMAFVIGLLCRRASAAVACGALWAGTNVAATAVFRDATFGSLLQLNVPYLSNALVGWLGGSMLRRNEELLAAAMDAEVRETAQLAASEQKWRLAAALHDGVLQTLETVRRGGGAIVDPVLRAEVAERASWLRRYIETGHGDQERDLGADLDAMVVAARREGISVQLNAARLLATQEGFGDESGPGDAPRLGATAREAMIEGLFHTITAFGRRADDVIVVRAVPDAGGVLITALSTADAVPDPGELAGVGARLGSVGGWLRSAPGQCVELWVPSSDGG
ncbi:MAG: hypothetical protein HOW97_40190 [Catenulispora sp.]|nr:hypothetical protein [Catenulispora sp.]